MLEDINRTFSTLISFKYFNSNLITTKRITFESPSIVFYICFQTFLPGFIPSSLHIKTPKGQRAVLALWCGIGKHKKENGNVIGCT